MKKKHINFNYQGYEDYIYTGLQGLLMRQNHKILSRNIPKKLNKKILEIGGAAKPHCSLLHLKNVGEYWISDTDEMFNSNKIFKGHNIKKHIYEDDEDYKHFRDLNHRFTRIIASHVWEHVNNPEEILLKWVSLLDDEGCIDISIPCDPGWAWRLGQLIGRRKAMRIYSMSSSDIDLLMTREHKNACQNLIRIIGAYTGKNGRYFPFNIPLININLFVFFRLYKSDFS